MKILFISGVPIDRTPVVKYTIDTLKNDDTYMCDTVEMQSSRIQFLFISMINILFKKYDIVFFVGIQTLPLLWIAQLRSFKIFNWFLESYEGNENNSFILKLKKIEPYINWKKVYAIFPIKERVLPYDSFLFKQKIIFPNASRIGNPFIKRTISQNDKVKIVMYGALDNERVYMKELIDFVSQYPKDLQLDLYGYGFEFEDNIKLKNNIFFHGLIPHDKLLDGLRDAHYSFIGYRPINFNTKFCAPNKLYEAMSLSLPVLLNENNPTLSDFEGVESIGILLDFSNLDNEAYSKLADKNRYENYNNNMYNNYQATYNLEAFMKHLEEKIRNVEQGKQI